MITGAAHDHGRRRFSDLWCIGSAAWRDLSGFVNGETSSVLGGTLSAVDSALVPTTAESVTYTGAITAAGVTSTNYTITYIGGDLTVTPAPLDDHGCGCVACLCASDPPLGVS